MLRQVLGFILVGIIKCINLMKEFVIDKVGNMEISLYHFLLFGIFIAITIRVINFIKQVQETESENEKNKFLKERRYK